MYESIRIQNFRGLKDVTIENLGRVNLLVGANNVGKTSVLEALALLHMHSNFYEVYQIAESRGYVYGQPDIGLFSGMFPNGDSALFSVEANDRGVSYEVMGAQTPYILRQTIGDDSYSLLIRGQSPSEQLILRYQSVPGEVASLVAEDTFRPGQWPALPVPAVRGLYGEVAYLPAFIHPRFSDMPAILTDTKRRGQLPELLDAMRRFDPSIVDMSAALSQGGWSVDIYSKRNGSNHVFPLSGLGTGARRLWEMLITLPRATGGVALIDEIESGVYVDNLADLWSAVGSLQASANLQVLATTHSWECVEAALKAFGDERAAAFRLVRLERDGDKVQAVTAEHHQVESTVALGFDVR